MLLSPLEKSPWNRGDRTLQGVGMAWTDDNEGGVAFNPEEKIFHVNDRALGLLREMAGKMVEGSTEADALRYAIDFLSSIIEERSRGNPLCLKTPEGMLLIQMPFLRPMKGYE